MLPSNHSQGDRSWYAVRVRSKFEKIVSGALRGKGYEDFLPSYRSTRRWSDRAKEIEVPLFPSYLFCRLDIRERLMPVLSTPGVIGFVGIGKTPMAIPEVEIEAIYAVVRSGLGAKPWPNMAIGDQIVIERGPLAGLEGVALNVDKKLRLVVSVALLQRSIAVEIDRSWARPIPNSRLLVS